jgi:hypothetical protein
VNVPVEVVSMAGTNCLLLAVEVIVYWSPLTLSSVPPFVQAMAMEVMIIIVADIFITVIFDLMIEIVNRQWSIVNGE